MNKIKLKQIKIKVKIGRKKIIIL